MTIALKAKADAFRSLHHAHPMLILPSVVVFGITCI